MNRRSFLKSIGKVVAGCAVVLSVAKAEPKRLLRTEKEYLEARAKKGLSANDICNEALSKLDPSLEDKLYIEGMMEEFVKEIHK